MPLLSEIEFGALAQYSPRGTDSRSVTSKSICLAAKRDGFLLLGGQSVRIIDRLVSRLREKIAGSDMEDFFADGPMLVPAPRSSPVKAGSLYPTKLICEELLRQGFGSDCCLLLRRAYAVEKAATAAPGDRPTAKDHYDSLRVEKELLSSGSILVVDDVITTGSMTIASVSRLKEAYPRARLRAFGLFRTISSGEIDRIYEPCAGTITLRHGRCTRTP